MTRRPVRKPSRYGGLQVNICGKKLSTETSLICSLPFSHYPTNVHGTLAITDEGEIIAIVDTIGNGVESWQLTGNE